MGLWASRGLGLWASRGLDLRGLSEPWPVRPLGILSSDPLGALICGSSRGLGLWASRGLGIVGLLRALSCGTLEAYGLVGLSMPVGL